MIKKMLILFVLLFTLLLVACGGQADGGDTGGELDHTVDCGEEEPGDLADLGGRQIYMAVENAYPPFNYLDDSGSVLRDLRYILSTLKTLFTKESVPH